MPREPPDRGAFFCPSTAGLQTEKEIRCMTLERKGPEIVRGLEAAALALDAGDAEAAAEALEAVSAACDEANASGEQLTPEELARAAPLHARCLQAAEQAGNGLVASLLQSAKLRSASHAYKSRT